MKIGIQSPRELLKEFDHCANNSEEGTILLSREAMTKHFWAFQGTIRLLKTVICTDEPYVRMHMKQLHQPQKKKQLSLRWTQIGAPVWLKRVQTVLPGHYETECLNWFWDKSTDDPKENGYNQGQGMPSQKNHRDSTNLPNHPFDIRAQPTYTNRGTAPSIRIQKFGYQVFGWWSPPQTWAILHFGTLPYTPKTYSKHHSTSLSENLSLAKIKLFLWVHDK